MLAELLTQVTAIIVVLLVGFVPVCIGRRRLRATRREWRDRMREAAPVAGVVLVVLLANRFTRQRLPDISWAIDWNLTPTFYAIEGEAIIWFQQFASPLVTQYFSFVYIYGYVFILVFPVIAYFALSDTRPLRELLSAYALNYLIGLFLYLLVIAYGPRNIMPTAIETVLYDFRPQYQYLTQEVNHNTNVFPSLHTSLSATIAIFAYRTRDEYPIWFAVAVPLAASIAVSTMYLGIHWAIDVVAGIALAVGTVYAADRFVGRWSLSEDFGIEIDEYVDRIRRTAGMRTPADPSPSADDEYGEADGTDVEDPSSDEPSTGQRS
ncbi:phosphoesterase PA-phosphatase-like protein [Haloterrigena salina JCM 13891]|uniref:Phosphoesterase PA-phosphatase-like protein n=1 Tax=Haloterrigena salina JCM 13891 TaxID=1227488 RepID=M0BTV0_9EURY|nr:phosphatase PAP2 family protein [Haloterrigena salina]ELZ14461.1 phosphoesterase PA-phosphatase-like protein [Haloterrigena salina JCM 13891]